MWDPGKRERGVVRRTASVTRKLAKEHHPNPKVYMAGRLYA